MNKKTRTEKEVKKEGNLGMKTKDLAVPKIQEMLGWRK